MDLLSFIFPKRCVGCRKVGSFLCDPCFTYLDFNVFSVCGGCGKTTLSGLTHPSCHKRYTVDGIFVSLAYNSMAKKLIRQFVFPPYLSSLKSTLATLCFEGLIQQELFMKIKRDSAILVPIPLHTSRLKQRGYNQAYLLTDELSHHLTVSMSDVLQRVHKTTSRGELSQKKRRENIKDAFVLKERAKIKGKTIFLVDDIVISGTTISEAAKVLKKGGAKRVYGIAVARGA